MKKIRKALTIISLILVVLTFTGICRAKTTLNYPDGKENIKNIIFCIGDGMGLGQTTLARMKTAGPDGMLCIERMPVIGLVRTHSANALRTDSAAAGTALASGVKTNNKMLGMTADGKKYQTILEAAKAKGMRTGLVATSAITHATPASFGAHVESRRMENEIAEQLIANKIHVLLGGGRQHFLPKSDAHSKRNDKTDLIKQAKKAGYCYVQNAEELKNARGPYLLGLFQTGPLTTRPPEPTLAELTEKAIEVLDRKDKKPLNKNKGFFLMVEGSQIDGACHDNDVDNTVRQVLCFDEAVKSAIEFALKDGQTLVVATADHETGGLTINGGSLKGDNLDVHWSTKGHSCLPVPLYAFGPNADMFSGVYDNTEVPKKFAQLLGIKSFPKVMD
jgi:alkaline phosphatase